MLDEFFVGALLLTSVVAVAFIFERGFALRWKKVIPPQVEMAMESFNSGADLPVVRAACEQNPSALSRLLLGVIGHLRMPRAENVDALETRARREVVRLERWLVVLEIIVGIAPLMGLVGTVYGLIILFGGISKEALGDYSQLARGIGLALKTTLMGLLIAIPSLIAWSFYTKKVENLTVEMETICDEFMRRAYRKPDGRGEAPPAESKLSPSKSAASKPA